MPQDLSLDQIAETLERFKVRATYGAVAGYLGVVARSLMQDIERAPRYSWIVSKQTSQPTDYLPGQVHPDLEANRLVLADETELRRWLSRKLAQPAAGGGGPAFAPDKAK